MTGARGLLVSICGGNDLLLWEVDEAVRQITDLVDADADIIWGSRQDPSLDGRMRASIVAAGIGAAARTGLSRFVAPELPDAELDFEIEESELAAAPAALVALAAAVPEPAPAPLPPSLFERMAEAARSGQVQAVLAAEAAGASRRGSAPPGRAAPSSAAISACAWRL